MSHRDQEEDTVIANNSQNPHFAEVLQARLSRRQALLGGLSATTAAVFGGLGLSGCDSNDDNDTTVTPPPGPVAPKLNFSAVDKALFDHVGLPAGYTATVLYALGDPIKDAIAAYKNDGTDTDHDQRAGDHHDGMSYFGLGDDGKWAPSRSDRGLLCMNHENITQKFLHAAAPSAAPRNLAEVRKEMNCHGVSVVEVKKDGAGKFAVVQDSDFNRRITPFTEMEIRGPVRGSKFVVTRFSTTGQKTRGTINNCANGYTPWGTYLTAEENWNGYFRRNPAETGRSDADKASLARYGVSATTATGNYLWTSIAEDEDAIKRLDISSDAARTAAQDYRNEVNTYGWIVEIDPFNPTAAPRKRTALGRFGHEGCWPAKPVAGRPVVFYMGDDRGGDYIYKFVSAKNFDPADRGLAAGDKYMDEGTLYVAVFNSDGSGGWKALVHGSNGLTEDAALYPFTSQAAVLVNTRLAADHVGATPMDRPEWAAVNPFNGEVYLTLTNNSGRTITDAANPRRYNADGTPSTTSGSNVNGHVIRWREDGDEPAATSFKWDVYLFGARALYANEAVNASALTDANDFSSPDGLWFDPRGVLWIQTDDGAYTDVTNCMMLAAVPGKVGDGSAKTLNGQATFVGKAASDTDIRRFLVGPKDCEITGVDITPDGKTMFVNIQHPGDGGSITDTTGRSWPNASRNALDNGETGKRPRSATVCITRTDGGVIGL
ncbi:MAG TPA: PhoX family phosphatase [Solimonas sp.]|nr:PhoX family phosphatase [Solimonas sp.]